MASSFWMSSLLKEDKDSNTSQEVETKETELVERVPVHQKDAQEEISHELAIDIYEREDRVFVVVPIAGVKQSDVYISVGGMVVTIEGERKNPFAEHKASLYSSECFWGKFERSFTLPSFVDTREMQATIRNGILLIEAQRISPSGVRKVHIR
ncbi:hypothetical protein COB57_05990 [Candidatus Peregrinibacteria bacterium]|nr:MAG: hypothetical protein COB57_05990 [Candidatus Peregrinibacteria bacterium]